MIHFLVLRTHETVFLFEPQQFVYASRSYYISCHSVETAVSKTNISKFMHDSTG
jgi:hypothetical protein